ncbi:hypothetical protein APHAL10511_004709 [Amanita phalloides]|nr:hypothetical protein APHAL10511_004709 [Amanita phalloides]
MSSGPYLHDLYYFADGNLKLQVENAIYLVHRYLFSRHSHKFIVKDLADSGYPLPNVAPHLLDGVKRIDFDRLLSCLYPFELMVEEARSSEEWTSILKLATKWEFASLRQRAINELDGLASPIDKVLLGQDYDIPELRLPGYVDLCRSNVPLSEEDGERLGLKDVIKIYRVRQELWGRATMPVPLEDILMKVRVHFSTPVRLSPPSCPPSCGTSPTPSVRSFSPVTPPRWPPSPHIPARSSPSATSLAGHPKEESWAVANSDKASVINAPQSAVLEIPISSPPAPQPVPVSLPLADPTKLDGEAQRIDWAEDSSQAMASLTGLVAASTTSAIPPAAPQAYPGKFNDILLNYLT